MVGDAQPMVGLVVAPAPGALGLRTGGLGGRHGGVTWTLPEPMLAASVPDPVLLPGWAGEPKLWAGFCNVRCPDLGQHAQCATELLGTP